jgi:putative endonuclease
MTDKIKTGNQGEEIAAEFLQQRGYEILARNYRYKHSEIDLIVRKNDIIVFVEVKTRSSSGFGEPEAFVGSKKAAKIFEGADQYGSGGTSNGGGSNGGGGASGGSRPAPPVVIRPSGGGAGNSGDGGFGRTPRSAPEMPRKNLERLPNAP